MEPGLIVVLVLVSIQMLLWISVIVGAIIFIPQLMDEVDDTKDDINSSSPENTTDP